MYIPLALPFSTEQSQMCPGDVRNLYSAALNLAWRLHYPNSHPTGLNEKWGELTKAVGLVRYSPELPEEVVWLAKASICAIECDTLDDLRGMARELQQAVTMVSTLLEADSVTPPQQ